MTRKLPTQLPLTARKPPPPPSPPRRRKPRQVDRLLQYLRDEGSVSRFEAFAELGIVELASRIGELERDGVRLRRETERRTNRYEDEVRYTRYHLIGVDTLGTGGYCRSRDTSK